MRPGTSTTSLDISRSLIDNGVDLLELGVPFSDPLADGLTNQLAAQRALESGACQSGVFRLVEEIRKHSEIPIVFYTYYNLIFSQGIEQYVIRSRKPVSMVCLLWIFRPRKRLNLLRRLKITG